MDVPNRKRETSYHSLYYQTTRSGKHPKTFLSGFYGYLYVYGYASYHDLPKVELVGCGAHVRREFDEVLKSLPANLQNTELSCAAKIGLQFFNRLFAINKMDECTPEQDYKKYLKQGKPVLDEFLVWLKIQKARVAPKTKL